MPFRMRWRDWMLAEPVRVGLPLLVLGLALAYSGVVPSLDRWIYDAYVRAAVRVPASDVMIVAVDARSVEAIGQWPWSRAVHADLVDRLTEIGARTVVFDVAFAEPHATDPEGDRRFAEAIARSGRVVLPVVPERRGPIGGVKELAPLGLLANAAARLGHADVEIDEDGVSRRVYLMAGESQPRWPQLALAALALAEPQRWKSLPGLRAPEIDPALRPVSAWQRDHEVLVGFAGPPGQFRFVSYIDVLRDERELSALANAHVFVGVTAFGLRQGIVTPVSARESTMSGVEFNANVFDALRGNHLMVPAGTIPQALIAGLCFLLPVLVLPRLSPVRALLTTVGAGVAGIGLGYLLFNATGVWIAQAFPLSLLALGYPVWLLRRLETTSSSLAAEQEHSRAALQSIADAVVTIDGRGVILQMNAGAERMSGYELHEAVGLHIWSVFQPVTETDQALLVDSVEACIGDGEIKRPAEHVDVQGRAGRHSVRLSVSPLISPEDPDADALVVALSDITDTIRMSERMAHLATHDLLTGLPNRALFTDRLTQAAASARLHGDMIAVLFIDIDAFKRVNESLGHTAGDAMVGQLAQRLHGCCRPYDTLARWGGDEFVVMLQGISRRESVLAIAREFLAAFGEPFRLAQREIRASASIGVALFPHDAGDVESLLANADSAMHRAKASGPGAITFYSEPASRAKSDALSVESALRGAAVRGEFSLALQPQIDTADGRLSGLEALLRWRHPHEGELLPERFIEVAEDHSLMPEIGEWVLEEVCRLLPRCDALCGGRVALGINLSPRQVTDPDFPGALRFALDLHRVEPARIVVEVPERVFLEGPQADRAIAAAEALSALGVRLAIDDFGGGAEALALLRRFRVHQIKFGRTLTRDLGEDDHTTETVRAVTAVANGLEIDTVAVGVETERQFRAAARCGCRSVQGFLRGRPAAIEELQAVWANPRADVSG